MSQEFVVLADNAEVSRHDNLKAAKAAGDAINVNRAVHISATEPKGRAGRMAPIEWTCDRPGHWRVTREIRIPKS